ncbi:MAG: DAK2 domain-containing protein, partial [Ruminococcaceae bacterium]|nr:DAK2 domain-containing protein [Oscillospiraceae bacterium]
MISGAQLRDAIISGANNIINLRSSVDELNVFPVPDGDTGTNMSMTIGSAIGELENLPDSCTVEQASQVAASALLRGARGNSGVILSLLFRGFSRALQGKTEATSEDLYISLSKGVEAAYKAVMKPTEGTILTVAREASEKAATVYETTEPVKLWEIIVEQSKETLLRTPDMLPVLKKAGVVDSGGQGLVYI